jgi:NADP-dependent 3-hydroxy acid dehydrogenase YdfG
VKSLPDFADARVVPLQLDITDDSSVKLAAAAADDVDVLLNNAGTMAFGEGSPAPRKWSTPTCKPISTARYA